MKIKSIFKEIPTLFSGWELLFNMILSICVIGTIIYYLTTNVYYTIALSVLGALFHIFVFIVPNERLRKHQNNLGELLKYVTNMTFFLQTRNNVYHSMKAAQKSVSKTIQKDINKTLKVMEERAVLDTKHFLKYDSPTLNQFHHHLKIKYDRGGDSNELFDRIQQDMLFELKKRDELYRKRKGFSANVYVLLGLVSSIMIILRTFVPFLWEIFLNYKFVSLTIISTTFLFILLVLYFLQKKNVDISIRV